MTLEREPLQNPEKLSAYFGKYVQAIAKHQIPGQDSEAAKAVCRYEERDHTEGVNRHYWIDYEFETSTGSTLFLRFQHAGHIQSDNIDWSSSRGHVNYFMGDSLGLMLLYTNSGGAWFNPTPSMRADFMYAKVPDMPNVDVRTDIIRASHGWLDRFLEYRGEGFSNRVRNDVSVAIDRYNSGQTLPPDTCETWEDAEAQMNRLGARNFPEYLMYLFSELSQETGIMPFPEWVKKQQQPEDDN